MLQATLQSITVSPNLAEWVTPSLGDSYSGFYALLSILWPKKDFLRLLANTVAQWMSNSIWNQLWIWFWKFAKSFDSHLAHRQPPKHWKYFIRDIALYFLVFLKCFDSDQLARRLLQDFTRTINPTIFNIIRWVNGSLGRTTHRPSVWCSKYYIFS